MSSMLDTAFGLLDTVPTVVKAVSGGILLVSALAYFAWFRRKAAKLLITLHQVQGALAKPYGAWPEVQERVLAAARGHAGVLSAWLETKSRVLSLSLGQGTSPSQVMFGAPRDLWAGNKLLARGFNLPLADAIPNLLVGVGLLFTFLFLTLALTEATSALGSEKVSITDATRSLLQTAGAKFITSLVGLFASILWTWCARRWTSRLNEAAEMVLDRLSSFVHFSGGEMVMLSQLQTAREAKQLASVHADLTKEMLEKSNAQLAALEALLTESRQRAVAATHHEALVGEKFDAHLDLSQELLDETREQGGTLKRFETDMAVSLAGKITDAFSPQMEAMTSRLVGAVEGLSGHIGAMNEEALGKMLADFGSLLKNETAAEMKHLRETLAQLTTGLGTAGEAIERGAGGAAEKLDQVGNDLLARVTSITDSLSAGAASLQGATEGVKGALNELGGSIQQSAELGRQGADFLRGTLSTAETVTGGLAAASSGLGETVGTINRLTQQLAHASDALGATAREQHAVLGAVRETTPAALALVQQVTDTMGDAARASAGVVEETRASLEGAARALTATVAAITTGVAEYSRQVADLHGSMDDNLAKAVGSMAKGIHGLEESIEELGEVLSQRLQKG